MKIMKWIFSFPASFSVAILILVAWCGAAACLGQTLIAPQRSLLIPYLGGISGEVFSSHEWWRLLTSQFFHVHFMHMIFNCLCLFLVGGSIEQAYRWRVFLLIYLVGGIAGQAASVLFYPTLVSDGASQALMALCGAALILVMRQSLLAATLLIIAVQVGLDLHAVGTIKAGHGFGFVAGLLIGLGVLVAAKRTRLGECPNRP
jgi:rhomboid protease GluP